MCELKYRPSCLVHVRLKLQQVCNMLSPFVLRSVEGVNEVLSYTLKNSEMLFRVLFNLSR